MHTGYSANWWNYANEKATHWLKIHRNNIFWINFSATFQVQQCISLCVHKYRVYVKRIIRRDWPMLLWGPEVHNPPGAGRTPNSIKFWWPVKQVVIIKTQLQEPEEEIRCCVSHKQGVDKGRMSPAFGSTQIFSQVFIVQFSISSVHIFDHFVHTEVNNPLYHSADSNDNLTEGYF